MNDGPVRLCGTWRITTDPENLGRERGYYNRIPEDAVEIRVPGVIQEAYPGYDGVAWYYRVFDCVPAEAETRLLLKFNAVDYLAEVWLNGRYLGMHEDGEEPFEFDATEAVRPADNLLAVRVLSPYEDEVDGIALPQTSHSNKSNRGYVPGSRINTGGITQDVELRREAQLYIGDIRILADYRTGNAHIDLAVYNASGAPAEGLITAAVYENRTGLLKTQYAGTFTAPVGVSEHRLAFNVEDHQNWSVDSPNLYTVRLGLSAGGSGGSRLVRFGFRDFRVKDGYFYLNGKRVFVKSSHTGNCMPVGIMMSRDTDMVRRDLIYAKACGFNMVRFISGVALPEQLDFCDEIGLMVYEECYASWLLCDGPKMKERFDRATLSMVRRDRNHPSVVIWGLLNETEDGPVYRHARDFLGKLLREDDTRLVLLGSGRWDRETATGSLCNPGGAQWECQWGGEGTGGIAESGPYGGFVSVMGDVHIYPRLPQDEETGRFIRELGRNQKPVFISEYGHGSQNDVIYEYRMFEQNRQRTDAEDAAYYASMAECFTAEWQRLGMDGLYSFPEDFLTASMRAQCALRRINFDVIRANPMIAGYNLTGLLDHALTGEGLWTYWRTLKPGIADTLQQGWAPLRWCLFCGGGHMRTGSVRLEAVLANEDVLLPGSYPVRFRIRRGDRILWSAETEAVLPEKGYGGMPPLAVTVLEEKVLLDEPGEYEFAAELLGGGAPVCGRRSFILSRPEVTGVRGLRAAAVGLPGALTRWMESNGVRTDDRAELVLVGDFGPGTLPAETLRSLLERGRTVMFMLPSALQREENRDVLRFFGENCKCVRYDNWLYHLDGALRAHPLSRGLPAGLMEAEFWGPLFPSYVLADADVPEETVCAAFGVGLPVPGGVVAGLSVGITWCGGGRLAICTLGAAEAAGEHPAADMLLVNLFRTYAD